MKMSKSKINTYKKCPREFKYIYVDGIESPPNKYMQLGLDVHEIAEKVAKELQNKKNITEKDIKSSLILNDVCCDSEFDLSKHIDSLYSFFLNFCDGKYKIFGVEEHIYNSKLNINGIIDLIIEDQQTGNLLIIDYKTSKSKPITNYRLELCIYRNLVEFKYPNKKVTTAIIFFTKDCKYRGFNFANQQEKGAYVTDKDYKSVFDYINFVKDNVAHNIFPPKKQFLCKYCNFQKQCSEDGGF